MEANHVFNKLLGEIEHSKLNYVITRRTPFSASVCLKSSFVKHFGEEVYSEIKNMQISAQEREKYLECETKEQRFKIADLESVIEEQKIVFEEERVRLEQLNETEKENPIDLENQVASFREDLLKVKREKHNLTSSMKEKNDKIEALENEAEYLTADKEVLKGMVEKNKVALDEKTQELYDQKKENGEIKVLLDASNSDLCKSKLKKQTENQPLYECSECSFCLPSYKLLKQHIRSEHCRNKATQNDIISIFEEYLCYYCDEIISSTSDLGKHTTSCHGCIILSEEVEFPCNVCETSCISMVELEHHMTVYHYEWDLPDEPNFRHEFPCDVCDTNCISKVELEQHIIAYHYTFYTEADLQSCDFCGLNFGTLGVLRSHIRSQHKEMLPT